ncbi:MAG: phosphate acyltransferase PlsX [Candidatus Omnitrophica bacterium]|nr:phosphate acyltransferase PlsX [Candidatus Omnitrophota bacterium]
MNYKIGLDVSGGDCAPLEPLKGAELARGELDASIVLLGMKEEIARGAQEANIDLSHFEIVEAEEKIEMAESPAYSVRRKKRSSIVIASNMIKNRQIDAFVSCGNTGAVVCASSLLIRLIEGVERPGIGILLPTLKGVCLLIDAGANIEPKPLHLFQYGIMASLYYSSILGKKEPVVGLLNIGEEESKGPDFMKTTHRLFSQSTLNFAGNIEPKSIFSGDCDCVICDGYVGNVVLKLSEGLADAMGKFLALNIKNDPLGKVGALLMRSSLQKFKKSTDYAEYGGAPLLGIDGVVIIGHGRSHAYAIKNALKVAQEELKRDLNARIKGRIDEVSKDSRIREILAA